MNIAIILNKVQQTSQRIVRTFIVLEFLINNLPDVSTPRHPSSTQRMNKAEQPTYLLTRSVLIVASSHRESIEGLLLIHSFAFCVPLFFRIRNQSPEIYDSAENLLSIELTAKQMLMGSKKDGNKAEH